MITFQSRSVSDIAGVLSKFTVGAPAYKSRNSEVNMKDERIVKLAHNLVDYSVGAKKGDKILIEAFDIPYPLITELVKAAYEAGAQPFVTNIDTRVRAELIKGMTDEQLKAWSKIDAAAMSQMDCYIGVRGSLNAYENSS